MHSAIRAVYPDPEYTSAAAPPAQELNTYLLVQHHYSAPLLECLAVHTHTADLDDTYFEHFEAIALAIPESHKHSLSIQTTGAGKEYSVENENSHPYTTSTNILKKEGTEISSYQQFVNEQVHSGIKKIAHMGDYRVASFKIVLSPNEYIDHYCTLTKMFVKYSLLEAKMAPFSTRKTVAAKAFLPAEDSP